MTTYLSAPPEWLPADMRHTVAPIERLRSILTSLANAPEGRNDVLLRARAAKVRHLCRQIDAAACAGPIRPPADEAEARQVIQLAITFLEEPRIAAHPPVALIYSIYACAVTLSGLAQQRPLARRDREAAAAPAPNL